MASRTLTLARRAALACAPVARNLQLTAVRALASKADSVAKSKKEKDLASILQKEFDYEQEDNNTEQTIKELAQSLEGWTINEQAGHARFSVTRKWGQQTLRVDVDCTPMPGDDEYNEDEEKEEDEGPMDGYRMLVSIGHDSKAEVLQVGCFVTDHMRIHRVTVFPKDKAPTADHIFGGSDDSPLYGGPNFEELDQAVQNGFYDYLADRGIDDTLAEKLGDYAAAKEQVEYLRWLQATKAAL